MSRENWDKYSEVWSLPEAGERVSRLKELTASGMTYTDPTTAVEGVEALAETMGNFQKDIPGAKFVITQVIEHHQQSLAHWEMQGADGSVMMPGTSHALLSDDGKFRSFTGFFPIPG